MQAIGNSVEEPRATAIHGLLACRGLCTIIQHQLFGKVLPLVKLGYFLIVGSDNTAPVCGTEYLFPTLGAANALTGYACYPSATTQSFFVASPTLGKWRIRNAFQGSG